VQGVEFYKNVEKDEDIPGVMHAYFGDYHIRDVKFVAAFEVNKEKIGKDISEAIWVKPNCCAKFSDVPKTGAKVYAGPISDGVAPHMYEAFQADKSIETVDVAQILKDSDADMLINYLPVGSAKGTQIYAQAAHSSTAYPSSFAASPSGRRGSRRRGCPSQATTSKVR